MFVDLAVDHAQRVQGMRIGGLQRHRLIGETVRILQEPPHRQHPRQLRRVVGALGIEGRGLMQMHRSDLHLLQLQRRHTGDEMHARMLRQCLQQMLCDPQRVRPVAAVERGDGLVVELNLFAHGCARSPLEGWPRRHAGGRGGLRL
ncbi:hypothetical protein NG825_14305 [Xanthomonas sacchari]|nr:hypothetical protein NG825_14305 [Xanthomonas sacchari]